MFALRAYLERIGLPGLARTAAGSPRADVATLRELHHAHVTSIPFENLDPLRGVPTSVELGDLQRKLVRERRGGFCFEHNSLLAAALVTLGYEVEPMLGRVGPRQSATRARSHMLLRVRDAAGGIWHADVGFGAGERSGTLLEPVPFGPGGEYSQSGWCYRVESYGSELVLMALSAGSWSDMYSFVPEPVPLIDIETSNWFAATHPRSIFTRSLVISSQAGGRRSLLSDAGGALTLLSQTPAERTVTEVERTSVASLLADRFELPGWILDSGTGRPAPANS